jgi:hypothetical protein
MCLQDAVNELEETKTKLVKYAKVAITKVNGFLFLSTVTLETSFSLNSMIL